MCRMVAKAAAHDAKAKPAAPPEGSYEIKMPPERHVPVTAHEIVEVFRPAISSSERAMFADICKLIEACSMTEHLAIRYAFFPFVLKSQ